MDYDAIKDKIKESFYRCNVLSADEAEGHANIAINIMKRELSTAEVITPVPNQAMKDFSVQGALREYEYSDTFKHLFSDAGEVL